MSGGFQAYRRVDLASEQLGVAFRLFLDERSYAAALTLAGAAEEVLGRAVEHKGKKSSLQEQYEMMAPLDEMLKGKPLKYSQYADEMNEARNALKHMRSPDEITFTADLEMAAVWMLARASSNYERLGLEKTDDMRRFEDWFYVNVVGLDYDY